MPDFVIGIGGTGARCLEAFIYLCAAGALQTNQEVRLLGVDQDRSNEAWDEYKSVLDHYLGLRNASALPATGFDFFGINLRSARGDTAAAWTPLEENHSLRSEIGIMAGDSDPMALLAQTLFRDEELGSDLDKGFGGRTNVGATVFHLKTMKTKGKAWEEIFHNAQGKYDIGKAFIIGSFFGGTGASALPVLGSFMLREVPQQLVGAAAVGPYFKFEVNEEVAGKLPVARSEHFLERAQAALYHYANKWERDCPFHRLYLVGDVVDNWKKQPFSRGGNAQKNTRHHVEMLAGAAAVDFLGHPPAGGARGEVLVVRSGEGRAAHDKVKGRPLLTLLANQITVDDLPLDQQDRSRLRRFTAFCLALVSLDHEMKQLRGAIDRREWRLAWLGKGFNQEERRQILATLGADANQGDNQLPGLSHMIGFAQRYTRWLGGLHKDLTENVLLLPGLFREGGTEDEVAGRAMAGSLQEVLASDKSVSVDDLHAELNRQVGRQPVGNDAAQKFVELLGRAVRQLAPRP